MAMQIHPTDNTIVLGPLSINASDHTVLLNGHKLHLTQLEFKLLRLFALNLGEIISREQMIKEVWGYDYIGKARIIDVHIMRLRRKLGDDDFIIETIYGIGYMIDG